MGTYRMTGNKTPGSSANETGTGLPPSLTGWVDSLSDVNWMQLGKNLKEEWGKGKEKREEKRIERKHLKKHGIKGAKKKRFMKNAPKDGAENAQFIAAGGGSRPAY